MHLSDARFVLEFAVIVMAAKLAGRFTSGVLKQPAVIGEMLVGILIGPYALGGLSVFSLGPVFATGADGIFHEGLLHGITIAGIVTLLFTAGLETDLRGFMRFAPRGLGVGAGGAVVGFAGGALAVVAAGGGMGFHDPRVLAFGAVASATSISLAARLLYDMKKLNSPEGSVTLSAAVIDDVIGLIILAVVISIPGGGTGLGSIAVIALKGFGFFAVLLALGLLLQKKILQLMGRIGDDSAQAAFALAMGLFAAGLAEYFGLAMVVGAYVMGLALSGTRAARRISEKLITVKELLVPVFFCVTGMMVDIRSLGTVLVFGLVFTAMCVAGKFLGCYLPSRAFRLSARQSTAVGLGMLPRLEVGLVAASMAMLNGLIDPQDMGVVMIMIVITAVMTPPLLTIAMGGANRPNR
jgi:Kef-type K+ transport system membrane component KefB